MQSYQIGILCLEHSSPVNIRYKLHKQAERVELLSNLEYIYRPHEIFERAQTESNKLTEKYKHWQQSIKCDGAPCHRRSHFPLRLHLKLLILIEKKNKNKSKAKIVEEW